MNTYVLPNDWFLSIDGENPSAFEVFTTKNGKPDGERKLYRIFMHDGPPYASPLIEEMDVKEDGTVGAIEPLVCVTSNGTFVAVKSNKRHMGELVEAWRKSWSNPAEAPFLTSNDGKVMVYTDKELGRGYANTARILGEIGYRLVVVTAVNTPTLSEGKWMKLEDFMRNSFDQMGKVVIGTAKILGYL